MTDTNALKKIISQSGLKKNFICKKIGLSMQGFLRKLNNESDFRQGEIKKLCEVLDIDASQRDKIFFA